MLLSGGGEGAHRWLSSSASTSAAISPSVLALATTPLAASLAAPSAPCTLYPVPSASSASAASASAPSQLAAASRPSPSHPMCSSSTLRASAFQEAAASSAVDSPRPLPSMRMGFVRSAEGLALLAASPTALPSVLSILERVATCSVGLMAFASVLVQRPHTPSVLSALSEAILRELRPLRTMLWSVDAQASDAQRALAAAMHACVHTHMHMCMHTKHIRTGERCSEGARGRPAATPARWPSAQPACSGADATIGGRYVYVYAGMCMYMYLVQMLRSRAGIGMTTTRSKTALASPRPLPQDRPPRSTRDRPVRIPAARVWRTYLLTVRRTYLL